MILKPKKSIKVGQSKKTIAKSICRYCNGKCIDERKNVKLNNFIIHFCGKTFLTLKYVKKENA